MRTKLILACGLIAFATTFVGCTKPADDTNKNLTPSTPTTTPMPPADDTPADTGDTNTTNN